MGTKKNLEPIDEHAADVLREGVEAAGKSYRALKAGTDISINRIGIILRKEPPPATVGEIGAIAQQVGMTASQVIREAERRNSNKLRAVKDLSGRPAKFDPEALGLAAKRYDLDEDNDQ